MGERKVINKYYPSDFDPNKLKLAAKKNHHHHKVVRMMLPLTIRCSSCGDYVYRGRKFNCGKEKVAGESYLGAINLFRFYFKCPNCCGEISIKTDPKNSGYVVESGARTLNVETTAEEEEEEEEEDVMTRLDSKRMESEREMKINACIDELQSMQSRHQRVNFDSAMESSLLLIREKHNIEMKLKLAVAEEDEAVIKSIQFHQPVAVIKKSDCFMVKKRKRSDHDQPKAPKIIVKSCAKTNRDVVVNDSALKLLCQQYNFSSSED